MLVYFCFVSWFFLVNIFVRAISFSKNKKQKNTLKIVLITSLTILLLVSMEDCVNDERENLALYALRRNEKLIIAVAAELKLKRFVDFQNNHGRKKALLNGKENSLRSVLEKNQKHGWWKWMGTAKTNRAHARNRKPFLCSSRTGSAS